MSAAFKKSFFPQFAVRIKPSRVNFSAMCKIGKVGTMPSLDLMCTNNHDVPKKEKQKLRKS